jgi:hypothetical protein
MLSPLLIIYIHIILYIDINFNLYIIIIIIILLYIYIFFFNAEANIKDNFPEVFKSNWTKDNYGYHWGWKIDDTISVDGLNYGPKWKFEHNADSTFTEINAVKWRFEKSTWSRSETNMARLIDWLIRYRRIATVAKKIYQRMSVLKINYVGNNSIWTL